MMLAVLGQELDVIEGPVIDYGALAPLLVLLGGALVLLVVAALVPRKLPRGSWAVATVVTCLVAIALAVRQWGRVQDDGPFTAVAEAITIDGYSVFFTVLITAAIALAALLADGYLRREDLEGSELYVLMLFSGAGGIMMALANDLIIVFLGLEILSIALYVLAGYHLRRNESREAAIKYFVLGAFSSAFLLYGIALVYGATGSTNLSRIAAFLSANLLEERGLLFGGFALLLVGLGFKVAAAPFHVWTPDVYQGAPTPVTAFMASASKAAGFAGLLRVFLAAFEAYEEDWRPIVFAIAVLTLLVGSLLAIVQTDVKRMMAYSSISHAGFILVGAQAASDRGASSALFYLLAYTFMVVGSFGVITLVGRTGDAAHGLGAYRGLSASRPLLALVFTIFLLAQAGVPFTSGFFAKFYVIGAAVESESYALAIIAMLSAVISAFIYLRIIVTMYMAGEVEDETSGSVSTTATAADLGPVRLPVGATIALGITVAVTLFFGFLPGPAVSFAEDAVPVLLLAAP